VQVDPGSDFGEAMTKGTTPQTAVSAVILQDVVETRDAGDIRDSRELEKSLVVRLRTALLQSQSRRHARVARSRGPAVVKLGAH